MEQAKQNLPQKIKPLFDRVLLKQMPDQQNESGVYIPREQSDRSQIMTVVAIGDVKNVKQGDQVAIAKYAGTELTLGKEKYLIAKECDILCLFC